MKTLSYKDKDGVKQSIGMFNVQSPVVSQSTGQSDKEVMSQKAITDELKKKVNTTDVYNKQEVDDKIANIDIPDVSLPDTIEADKLKTPVKLWGQKFDGSKNIIGTLRTTNIVAHDPEDQNDRDFSIYTYNGRSLFIYENSDDTLNIGYSSINTIINSKSTIVCTKDITAPNITAIESKLEGVNKAADESKVVRYINVEGLGSDVHPSETGKIYLYSEPGILFKADDGEGFIIAADTDYLATKEDLESKADDSDVIKRFNIIDKESGNPGMSLTSVGGTFGFVPREGIIINSATIPGQFSRLNISADTNYLATRTYVDDKINFLVNSEGELEDSFDTLKEVDTWIKEHEGEAAEIISKQNSFDEWKNKLNSLTVLYSVKPVYYADKCYLQQGSNRLLDGSSLGSSIEFNAATHTTAGVMSATDKVKLDSLNVVSVEIEEDYVPDAQARPVKLVDANDEKTVFPATLMDCVLDTEGNNLKDEIDSLRAEIEALKQELSSLKNEE